METKTPIPQKEPTIWEKIKKATTNLLLKIKNIVFLGTSRIKNFFFFIFEKASFFMWNIFFALPLMRTFGEFLYNLGFQGEYRVRLVVNTIKRIYNFIKTFIKTQFLRVFKYIKGSLFTIWLELFRPVYVFFRTLYRIPKFAIKSLKNDGFLTGSKKTIVYIWHGLKRNVPTIPKMISYALPFVALWFMWGVLENNLNSEYTLAVQVNGQTVGNVASEQVFELAKADVQNRVDYTGATATSFDVDVSYKLSTKTKVLNQTQMADAIIETSDEDITYGTALKVDGELFAVTEGGEELKAFFNDLISPYQNPSDPNLTVKFNKDIELIDGLFFTESFSNSQEVIEYMSGLEQAEVLYTVVGGDSWSLIANKNGLTQAEIFNMNPGVTVNTSIFPGDQFIVATEQSVLEVLIVRKEEYDEPVPYKTETTESADYSFGSVKVLQEGVDGVRHVTAEVTYDVDGNILNKEIISNPIVVEPITKKVIKGTRLESGMIANLGTGSFLWPVPNYTYVSRWAHSSHKGVDICAPAGTPIYAADSGVVIKAGYNRAGAGSDYGYSIVIDHGNGYQTLYAHANALYVSVGQTVTQAQHIAGVGNTGRSFGNHLHFEIRENGVIKYPQTVFSASAY